MADLFRSFAPFGGGDAIWFGTDPAADLARNEFFGAATAGPQTITGTLLTGVDSFGGGTVSQGAMSITGTLWGSADTFGAGTVTRGARTLTGTLWAGVDSFGAGSVQRGAVTVTGSLWSSFDLFNAGAVSNGGGGGAAGENPRVIAAVSVGRLMG